MRKNLQVTAKMSSSFLNGSAIYLHTHADGSVWSGRKSDVPEPFDGDFSRLLQFKLVRLLGCSLNVPLINQLAQTPELVKSRLQLASPAFLKGAEGSPVNTIYRMRQYLMPAAVGGWHAVTATDLAAYQMVSGQRTVIDHPVWPRLSFAANLNTEAVQQVMGWILDPRWFAVVAHPERLTKIYAFLGMTAAGQRDFHRGTVTAVTRRFSVVCEAWNNEAEEVIKTTDRRNFICNSCARDMYSLTAAKLFVSFLIWNWRQVLADATPQQPEVFIPADLLGDKVGRAFTAHLERQKPCHDSKF